MLLAVGVGVAMTLVTVAVVFAVLAIPLFALARFAEPGQGLDRPFIRNGLLRFALPVGLVAGIVSGVAVGRWYRRGGRLPTE